MGHKSVHILFIRLWLMWVGDMPQIRELIGEQTLQEATYLGACCETPQRHPARDLARLRVATVTAMSLSDVWNDAGQNRVRMGRFKRCAIAAK